MSSVRSTSSSVGQVGVLYFSAILQFIFLHFCAIFFTLRTHFIQFFAMPTPPSSMMHTPSLPTHPQYMLLLYAHSPGPWMTRQTLGFYHRDWIYREQNGIIKMNFRFMYDTMLFRLMQVRLMYKFS